MHQDNPEPLRSLDIEAKGRVQRGKAYSTWVQARTEARIDKLRASTSVPAGERLVQVAAVLEESALHISDARKKELEVITSLWAADTTCMGCAFLLEDFSRFKIFNEI